MAEFRQIGELIVEVLDAIAQSSDEAGAAGRGGGARNGSGADRPLPDLSIRSSGQMRCPFCGQSRHPGEGLASDRGFRRDPPPAGLPDCGGRFTTFERVQLRELTVVKKNGRACRSTATSWCARSRSALRKRPVDPERVERMVSAIVRQLESTGETEIPSDAIGELVMEGLATLDEVAYVRFASVYRNFREAKDFETCSANCPARTTGDSATLRK